MVVRTDSNVSSLIHTSRCLHIKSCSSWEICYFPRLATYVMDEDNKGHTQVRECRVSTILFDRTSLLALEPLSENTSLALSLVLSTVCDDTISVACNIAVGKNSCTNTEVGSES
jgi:hypothetical protein